MARYIVGPAQPVYVVEADDNVKRTVGPAEPVYCPFPSAGGAFETALFGTPPNYAEFEIDGTLAFYGDATTWRDEFGPLTGSRLESPGSDIVLNLAEGTVTFEASARYPTDYVTYTIQINHDWLVQSECEFHVHWWQASAANVNWLIEYRWQVNGQLKTAGWTSIPLTTQIFTWETGTLNQINDGASGITPPVSAQLSDIFQVRLYRDYTNVSTLFAGAEGSGLDVEAMSADMHRRSDALGSREEYVK